MLSLLKKVVLLLPLLVFFSCASQTDDEKSFDSYNIAHVNNVSSSFSFDSYENVWKYPSFNDISSIDFNPVWEGICDRIFVKKEISYPTTDEGCCFVSNNDIDWRYGHYLTAPYCFFYKYTEDRKLELYAGTYTLFREGNNFYIDIIINKKHNSTEYKWDSISESKKTYQYCVNETSLAFF